MRIQSNPYRFNQRELAPSQGRRGDGGIQKLPEGKGARPEDLKDLEKLNKIDNYQHHDRLCEEQNARRPLDPDGNYDYERSQQWAEFSDPD